MRQADRLGAAHAVILDADGGAQLRDMSSGEQREIDAGASGRGARRDGDRARLRVPGSAAERLPRRLVRPGARATGSARRSGSRAGCTGAATTAGSIFVDLRDRTGLVQLVFNPDTAGGAFQLGHELRAEDVRQRRRRGGAARSRDGQPRAADGRVRGPRRRGDAAGGRRDAAVRDRVLLGRGGGGDAASPPLPRPAPRADARRRSSFATASPRRSGSS